MFGPVDRIFAPVHSAFAKARTHSDYRAATFFTARHLLTSYNPAPVASVIDHGPLRAAISLPDGSHIAPEDTKLLEVWDNRAQKVQTLLLAANAEAETDAEALVVFREVSLELNRILLEWSDQGKLSDAFGMVVVRDRMAFYQYRDEWRRW